MKITRRSLYGAVLLVVVGSGYYFFRLASAPEDTFVTTTVSEGSVQQLISVSGVIRAEDTAELGFPLSGVVENVAVRKGDVVATGTILATLDTRTAEAEVADAQAKVARARAALLELERGATTEARQVSSQTVELKRAALERTTTEENEKVSSAYRALLSSGLTAYSDDTDEEAVPPIISGTYTCDKEGTYIMKVFRSQSSSGYSFTLSGLETGTFSISFDQAIGFGTCGLRAQFDADSLYHNSVWSIDIPNKKSSLYITNRNAYTIAMQAAESAISRAEQELALAEAEATNTLAPARSEDLAQTAAELSQAEAHLARVSAVLADHTLRAPFSGSVVEANVVPGETVSTAPVITLLASDRYELTARVPEIDVSKLTVGLPAAVVFDTRSDLVLEASVDFISPKATTIDGVSYYETRLALKENPLWLRSGLNADIDIITSEYKNALRLPTRFVTKTGDTYSVLLRQGTELATTTIEVLFVGNDGYYAIGNLPNDTEVVAP